MRHLRRLFPYLRVYRAQLIIALSCALLASVFVMAAPLLVGWAIDFGLRPTRDAEGAVNGLDGDETFLILASLSVIAFAVGRGITSFVQQYLAEAVGQRIAYSLRNDIYGHLQRLSYGYHDRTHTGQIMARSTQDVENIRIFMNMGFVRLFYIGLLVLIATIGMFVINWQLAIVSFLTIPIIAYRSIYTSRKMRPVWTEIQKNQAEMTQVAEEGLSGIRVVKAFSQEPHESSKFRNVSQEQADLNYHQARLMARHAPLMQGLSMLQIAVTVGFGSMLILDGSLTEGALTTFVLWLSLLMMPIRSLGFVINVTSRAVSSSERIFELLDAESPVKERPGAAELNPTGHVRFEGVGFAYDDLGHVLKDIDIDAEPGKVVALLGPTGSGKSSVVNLIPRFYDVSEGRVTIDGTDVRDATIDSLRRSVGMVQQDVFLFVGTIRDNIAYGRPDATLEDVQAAAKAANIHGFIESLPYGYEEWVGENGITLSGGQKQRIAIARTLMLDPRILVFDDSMSSVDAQTEYLIQQALQQLMHGRTTFVIAQRLRTVRDADEIIVLDEGRIVQRGKHEELLNERGLYREIYDLELRAQEEAYEGLLAAQNGHGPSTRQHSAAAGGSA